MSLEERDCTNPYVKAANREYKLSSGGDKLCNDDIKPDAETTAEKPTVKEKYHLFSSPFLKAADKEYNAHTGQHLVATNTASPYTFNPARPSPLRKFDPRVMHRAQRQVLNRLFRIDPKIGKVLSWGALSITFYALLYTFSDNVIALSTAGEWWSFLVPVTIALSFSLAHGTFTGSFWDAVGLKPNTVRK